MPMYVSIVYEIAIYLLIVIGLWQLMKRCGIKPWYALIPYYQFYKIAEYEDQDEDGGTYMNASILILICRIFTYVFRDHTRTKNLLAALMLVFAIAQMIYTYRIFHGLCKKFGLKAKIRWALLWVIYPAIPALIWGFNEKYGPLPEVQEEGTESAELNNHSVKVLDRGLTVNLKERSVRNHMRKRYLLRDIHLNIKPGTMVLLLGGSGAGKTTFLNALTGYEPADADVILDGDNVYKNFGKMKYKIGFVPQQDLIRYEDTVERTLSDAAALRLPTEMSRKEKHSRVDEVLEIFGLTPVRENIVAKQSGGQKKRVSIAMEFISDPSLFILDEPDSGLDGILAADLMRRLNEIAHQGKIVVVITHTPDRVIEYFDEIIVLGKDANRTGRLVFHGSIEKAREFFRVEKMEQIVRMINCKDEGGEGLADSLIEKFEEERHGEH